MFNLDLGGRGRLVVVAALTLVGLAAPDVAHAYVQLIPVITDPADDSAVAAQGNVIAWTRNNKSNDPLSYYNLYVRAGTGPVWRVNPAGTQAYPGGFYRDRLIYMQFTGDWYLGNGKYANTDMYFYNTAKHFHGAVPKGWNTIGQELHPTISGHYVLFGRSNDITQQSKVILGDLTTGKLQALVSMNSNAGSATAGQVNGDYATYTVCVPNRYGACSTYVYDIATQQTTEIPNTFPADPRSDPPTGYLSGAMGTRTGLIYYWHTYSDTGSSLNKMILGQAPTTDLIDISSPDGFDDPYLDDSTGTPVIYIPMWDITCGSQCPADIDKMVDP